MRSTILAPSAGRSIEHNQLASAANYPYGLQTGAITAAGSSLGGDKALICAVGLAAPSFHQALVANHVARPRQPRGAASPSSARAESPAAATAAASTNVFGQYFAAAVIDVVQGKINR